VLAVCVAVLASCNNNKKKSAQTAQPPREEVSVSTRPGVAGGVYEQMITAQATVSAIDQSTRLVTLTGPDGGKFAFHADPQIKNLPQVRVGDKVTATFARRMVVVVRRDDASPAMAQTVAQASADKGQKPGALAAEEITAVARVSAIDPKNRTADLVFTDGEVKSVPVRPDVDLSRYKVGDNVVIRVTTALMVLVEKP
jgi:hypothetical protein